MGQSACSITVCPLQSLQLSKFSQKFWVNSFFSESTPVFLSQGEISSELYRDWLWDGNFKFCLIFTHFSRFSPFSGYIWWNNTLSSLENFSLNSILVFVFLMSQHDNGGFLKITQRKDSISKKTSFCMELVDTLWVSTGRYWLVLAGTGAQTILASVLTPP